MPDLTRTPERPNTPNEALSPPTAPETSSGGTSPTEAVSLRNVIGSVALSLAVLVGIGYFTFDLAAFRQMMDEMRPWPLLGAVVLTFSRVLFGGWRLQLIARGRLNLRQGARGQLAWDFFSNVTPSAIGGGPIATLYIARDRGLPVGEVTAFMLFAMLLDQLWFVLSIPCVLIATLYLEVIPASAGQVGLWAFVLFFFGMLAWAVLFAYATLFRPSLLERLADRVFSLKVLRRFRERVLTEMRTFAQRARKLRRQPPAFYLKGFLLTAGAWMGRYLLVVFIVWSVYPTFDTLLVLVRTMAMTLSSLILPTPGGSGGLEGLYAFFIGPLLPEALVAPTLLAWRTLGYYVFIALGAYLFVHQLRQMRPDAKNPHPPSPASTA